MVSDINKVRMSVNVRPYLIRTDAIVRSRSINEIWGRLNEYVCSDEVSYNAVRGVKYDRPALVVDVLPEDAHLYGRKLPESVFDAPIGYTKKNVFLDPPIEYLAENYGHPSCPEYCTYVEVHLEAVPYCDSKCSIPQKKEGGTGDSDHRVKPKGLFGILKKLF